MSTPASLSPISFSTLSPADRSLGASFSSLAPSKSGAFDAAPVSPMDQAKLASQETFSSVLSQHVANGVASKPLSSLTPAQRDERVRQTAEDFVAVAFVQPILKNLRSGGVAGELPPPFGPGPGEKQFRTIADAQLAKNLTHASRWPLVENLTKRLSAPRVDPRSKEARTNAPALPGSPADLRCIAEAKAAKAAAKAKQTRQPEKTDEPAPADTTKSKAAAISTFPSR